MKTILNLFILMFLTACALMSSPPASVTIRTVSPALENHGSLLGLPSLQVKSDNSLRNSRVLVVVDRYQLMQHEGLRWVSAPAAMLEANLRTLSELQTRILTEMPVPKAQLMIRLTAFQINTDHAKQLGEANIGFNAELQCDITTIGGSQHRFEASVPVAGRQPKQVAVAFQSAQDQAIAELLAWLSSALVACQKLS